MSGGILRLEGLRITARTRRGAVQTIVDGVDLELHRGEVLGLIGESGAGKTTIGLASLGYIREGGVIEGGRIEFDGTDLRGLSRAGRRRIRGRRIAYVAQSAAASFNPARTLRSQVCEMPVRHRLLSPAESAQQAVELFRELDLPSPETFGDRYPHQVSGGQLQRAMLAMAMSCRPDILVLDEPTTALDVTTQIEVLAAVRRLIRNHSTAALYISHDLAVVAQVADRIMVLQHGRMVECGEVDQILQRPQRDYTKRLVAAREAAASPPPRAGNGVVNPLLETWSITAGYGSTPVLRDVSVAVRRAETMAIVGESGSGKSTLARVICGLLPASDGEIRFGGKTLPSTLGRRSRDQLRRIQLIYQMPDMALNPQQSVGEILGRPLSFYFNLPARRIRARVEELLLATDLPPDFATRRPGELSGGQKQRICIARALAAEPDVIICDEVTSALDPLVADEILDLLQRLQQEAGIAYLFITHDLGIVRRIAHDVTVMRDGVVLAQGPMADIFAPPSHPYVETLLSATPELRVDWLDEALARRDRAGKERPTRRQPGAGLSPLDGKG